MTEPVAPSSGFQVFLPEEYQGEFSHEWIMGLSPFCDQTCTHCFTVQQSMWIELGSQEFDENTLKCEARHRLV